MKLKEIVVLEAATPEPTGTGPLELRALAQYYAKRPDELKKKLAQHWGKERLVYHGMKFFAGNDMGEAYQKADDAVEAWTKDDTNTVQMNFEADSGSKLDFDFEYEAHIDDVQEVYLGYQPHEDALYLGVDAWLSEDDFNEAWDKEFERANDIEFDHEDEEHAKVFDNVWKQYTSMHGYGILFKLHVAGEKFEANPVEEAQGGFYGGIYRSQALKRHSLIDIRLD